MGTSYKMKIFTIGFTKKTAQEFFTKLSNSGAKRLVDVRLNNVSQLAGFAKRDDLKYFLKTICQMEYVHLPLLAPTQDILDAFKKHKGDWTIYEDRFLILMKMRHIEQNVSRDLLSDSCLLCSEETPEYCHRRLVVEYLQEQWGDLEVRHIV